MHRLVHLETRKQIQMQNETDEIRPKVCYLNASQLERKKTEAQDMSTLHRPRFFYTMLLVSR